MQVVRKQSFSKKSIIALFLAIIMAFPMVLAPNVARANTAQSTAALKEMEYLKRGLVAILTDNGVFLSWRYLNTDPEHIAFNVYKNGMKVNAEPIVNGTNYLDTSGSDSSHYQISTIINGVESIDPDRVATWHNNYLPIRLDKPADGRTKLGDHYSYYAGDASVADVDGDGELEIVFLWSPNNSKDNSQSGYTGNVYIDAIELDGSKLWRIDLGVNIRAGAHYTQLMVYDLNSDGKAEVVVKTADGTIDGLGKVIGDASADHRNDGGYILTGPEYLTLFDGATGAAISTVDYHPPRGNVGDWGDGYGNRVDRFLAAIAYLDGEKPSVIVSRGYYTRTVIAAYDVIDNALAQRWVFDTNVDGQQYTGQGNHGLSVIDADGDGKDEIMFGALAIDDNGTVMYSTGLGHGDAMHAGKLDPNRAGYQVFSVHENRNAEYGIEMRDAATGEILWGEFTGVDTGRGMSADIDPNYPGYESWATGITDGAAVPIANLYAADGTVISSNEDVPKTANFAIWWDGDLQRELFDHQWDNSSAKGIPLIYKWDYVNKKLNEIFRAEGALTNNHTKGNPAIQADIIGDWREEFLVRNEDSTEYRLYSTTIPTDYRITTLMQDPTYRLAVAWQNVAYNQPPHTGFYLGTEATAFPKADISFPALPQSLEEVNRFSFGSKQVEGAVQVDSTEFSEATGYGFNIIAGLTVGEQQVTVPEGSVFQVNVPNENYRVTVKLGHETEESHTGLKSEYVQKLANTSVAAGESYTRTFDVAVVDNQLDFTFTGTANSIKEIVIEKYPAKAAGSAVTIYMAGDSTMQSYSDMFAPQQGWGEQFRRYFSSEVVVKNHAIGGRSSKSFLFDGRLDNILHEIKPGDYFFISFGHNDASAGIPDRYASPADYKMYLKRYIDGAKQRGATPIVLTPVGRRDFNHTTQQFNISFPDYVNAAREVAEQNNVQLIDLSNLSIAFYDEIGLAATEKIFLYANPGEYPRYPNGVSDNTHFSQLGAQAIAKLVAEAVKELELTISPYVIDPEFVMPEPEPEAQVFEEDFEPDGSVDAYSIVNATGYGGTLAPFIEEYDGSTVLRFTGGGSGPRARVFRLFDPIGGNLIKMNFDWHPGTIGITPNEGTISIQDSNENILLTLYAKSDSNPTAIDYAIGPNGDDRASSTVMNKQWVNVDLTINYQAKTMDLTLTSRADSNQTSTIEGIEIPSGINYQENVRAIRFLGTRASGRNLDWTTYLDNVKITGDVLPPIEGDKTLLVELYDEISTMDISSYTEQSKAVLALALAEVGAVIEDNLTPEQIKHLLNVLTVARDSLTTEAAAPVTEVKFDFGSGNAEDGYIKVDSTRAYIAGNHYGFLDTSLLVDENRDTGNALNEDFIRTGANTFFVEMEPANYHVQMVIGDSTEATNVAVVAEQMSKVASTTIPANEYSVIEYDIALIDGVFNFDISGTSAKINALTITKLDSNGVAEKPTIYLASDSTVANYAEGYRPQAGWGERLQDYLNVDEVTVDNRAIGGLSSKTFLVGGHLNEILLDIHQGDYLFMQWSHNDSTPSRPERYLTPEEFKVYLKTYIDGVNQRGATPVLVSPVNRRDFTGETLNKSFPAYVAAMKEVAMETGTTLLDLNHVSWEKFQELGPEGTKDVFMWVGTTEDNTHLQMYGANMVAGMVAQLLQESELPIATAVIVTEPEPEPTPTRTPEPTPTPTPEPTPTTTPEPTPTTTPEPTPTPTPEPTPTVTPEPTPTTTPEPTPTVTPEPTPTATPEPTPTATPEPTPTVTPEPTPTATPEPTPTISPEPTPTATPEPTPEPTPKPTPEPTPTISPEPTPTATPDPTPTTTPKPTPTATPEPEEEPWAAGKMNGPATVSSGHFVALNIQVSDIETAFNAIDVEFEYDPAKVDFRMVQGDDGAYQLDASAITNLDERLQVISTTVQPASGKVRVILLVTEDDSFIEEDTKIFTLKGIVKSGQPNGKTIIRITKFEVAAEGKLGNIKLDEAEHTINILAVPSSIISPPPAVDSDRTKLEQEITAVTNMLERAVEGEKVGQYKAGAIAMLKQAIDAAKNNGHAASALSSLQQAIEAFSNERVTLTGTGPISIADLSLLVKYYGVTAEDELWSEIEKADVLEAKVINIQTLAAIAQMIAEEQS